MHGWLLLAAYTVVVVLAIQYISCNVLARIMMIVAYKVSM